MATLKETTVSGYLKVNSSATANDGFQFNKVEENKWALTPTTKSKLDLGTPTLPFRNIYADKLQLTVPTASGTTTPVPSVDFNTTDTTGEISLGNNLDSDNANSKYGKIILYGKNKGSTVIQTLQDSKDANTQNTIYLPKRSGTISLSDHSHAFKTTEFRCFCARKSGNNIYYTKGGDEYYNAEGALYAVHKPSGSSVYVPYGKSLGTVRLKHFYGWGSDMLDIFVIRGYAEIIIPKGGAGVKDNQRIRLGCLKAKKTNYLPGGLVPLTIYRHSQILTKGMLTAATPLTATEERPYEAGSFIDIRCSSPLSSSKTSAKKYSLYFTATYGKLGSSVSSLEAEQDDDTETTDTGNDEANNS